MIELLNNYRQAKQNSEQAARELGREFGAAFAERLRHTQNWQEYSTLEPPLPTTINNLGKLYDNIELNSVGMPWIGAWFRGLICCDDRENWFVQVGAGGGPGVKPFESMPLEQEPFVLGFVAAVQETLKSNGKPSAVAVPMPEISPTCSPVA